MPIRQFDLNIEKFLEHWDAEHAVREIISNALDEQALTGTREVLIEQAGPAAWRIRDYGRGLRIEHFTLNENDEKIRNRDAVIGKFGVGLKDAVATLARLGASVEARSRFGTFRIAHLPKHAFGDIVTIHVVFDDSPQEVQGTEFMLGGLSAEQMAAAKRLFMRLSGEQTIEQTPIGNILQRGAGGGKIYISGVLAAIEPNFAFSYNVRQMTPAMQKRLNRERGNIGRSVYSDRVKAILMGSSSPAVELVLVEELEKRSEGFSCDEINWIDVSEKALSLLPKYRRVAYLTAAEVGDSPQAVDLAKQVGYRPFIVSEEEKARLSKLGGEQVITFEGLRNEYSRSFNYEFIGESQLTADEQEMLSLKDEIASVIGLNLSQVPAVKISKTLPEFSTGFGVEGVWDPKIPAIVLRREVLGSIARFARIFAHELAHSTSGYADCTREFESVLTDFVGRAVRSSLCGTPKVPPHETRHPLPDGNGDGSRFPDFMRPLLRAAESGDTRAASTLGTAYLGGIEVAQDFGKARFWLQRAAEAGDALAMNNLAVMNINGEGGQQDGKAGLEWLQRAAQTGDAEAMGNLAKAYHNGPGIGHDVGKALHWFRRAAEGGHVESMYNAGLVYHKGKGVSGGPGDALPWYERAAEAGHVAAMVEAGVVYYQGLGVAQSYEKAMHWYRRAAEAGDPRAMINLGEMFQKGCGAAQDSVEALKWHIVAGAHAKPGEPVYESAAKEIPEMESQMAPADVMRARNDAATMLAARPPGKASA